MLMKHGTWTSTYFRMKVAIIANRERDPVR